MMRKRDIPAVNSYLLILLAQILWQFGYAAEILSPNLEVKLFWDDFQFLALLMSVYFIRSFSLVYSKTGKYKRDIFWWLHLFVIFSFTIIVSLGQNSDLIRFSYRVGEGSYNGRLIYEFGLVSWCIFLYAYLQLAAVVYRIIKKPSEKVKSKRVLTILLIVSVAIPYVGFILRISGLFNTYERDITPFTFSISSAVAVVAVLRFKLFDFESAARDRLVETLRIPLLVFDNNWCLVDANQAAKTLCSPDSSNGKLTLDSILHCSSKTAEDIRSGLRSGIMETISDSCQHRVFEFTVENIIEENYQAGWMLLLYEVTGRVNAEREILKSREELELRVSERTGELQQALIERQRAEEEARLRDLQLMHADKMASLGILVAGVAHEINNPNNLILFNTDVLARIIDESSPVITEIIENRSDYKVGELNFSEIRSEVPRLLKSIKEGSYRIKDIVNGLKNFSKRDDEEPVFHFSLNNALDSALMLTGNLIERSTNSFLVQKASLLPRVFGKQKQIEQVIINLITNACQALASKDNSIVITTVYDENEKTVKLIVKDSGCGISDENIKRVFDPFFTTKRSAGGTGLGLSISFNIVKAHHGELNIFSPAGAGTEVTLVLPVNGENLI
ncbi:MAG: hypothetical protein JNL74_06300 [Fibrobacteres bacterium]|nr:hypothetical protein [Fibrobacterota bacterium]